MKNICLALILASTGLAGCNRETLQGLNLNFNAQISSDYQQNQEQPETAAPVREEAAAEPQEPAGAAAPEPETFRDKPVIQVNDSPNSDPDAPLAFRPLKDCSDAGVTARTNELFYEQNPQVKSINSKDGKQLKAWKEIYGKVKAKCDS